MPTWGMSATIPSVYIAQQNKEAEVWLPSEVKKTSSTPQNRTVPSSMLLFALVFTMQTLTLVFAFYQSLLENL